MIPINIASFLYFFINLPKISFQSMLGGPCRILPKGNARSAVTHRERCKMVQYETG